MTWTLALPGYLPKILFENRSVPEFQFPTSPKRESVPSAEDADRNVSELSGDKKAVKSVSDGEEKSLSNAVGNDVESDGRKAPSNESDPAGSPAMRENSGGSCKNESDPRVKASGPAVNEESSNAATALVPSIPLYLMSRLSHGLGPAMVPPVQHAKPPGQRSSSLEPTDQSSETNHAKRVYILAGLIKIDLASTLAAGVEAKALKLRIVGTSTRYVGY